MAKSCGYTVVAEGIETEAQADIMYSLGCELGQGFYFGQPEPQLYNLIKVTKQA